MFTKLSILIPAYNEEKRLPKTLRSLIEVKPELNNAEIKLIDIFIINDGSSDRTSQVTQSFRKLLPLLKGIDLKKNRGKGFAVRRGLRECKGDYVLIADADLSTPWLELIPVLKAMTRADAELAIGSRGLKGSQLVARQSFLRETLGKLFNLAIRVVIGLPFNDTQCGFKLFKTESIRPLLRFLTINRFAWDVEILTLATLNHLTIVEVPIRWKHRSESHVSLIRDGSRMLFDLIWLRLRFLFSTSLIPHKEIVTFTKLKKNKAA